MRPFLLLQRHKREPWAEPPTGGRCWECDSSHSVSAVPTSEPHEKAPESVLKVRESCKSLPLTPQGCTLSPGQGRAWTGRTWQKRRAWDSLHLRCLVRPMVRVPQKSSRRHRKWLDLTCLSCGPLNWAARPAAGGGGVDSVRTLSGGERGHLHQGVTTGPSKDLDMLPAGKPSLWTHVTESVNNQPVLAPETPNTRQRAQWKDTVMYNDA